MQIVTGIPEFAIYDLLELRVCLIFRQTISYNIKLHCWILFNKIEGSNLWI